MHVVHVLAGEFQNYMIYGLCHISQPQFRIIMNLQISNWQVRTFVRPLLRHQISSWQVRTFVRPLLRQLLVPNGRECSSGILAGSLVTYGMFDMMYRFLLAQF